jgi:hypothetical protein
MNAGATESLFNATFIRISLGQRKAKQLINQGRPAKIKVQDSLFRAERHRRIAFHVSTGALPQAVAFTSFPRVFVAGKQTKRRKDKHWEQYIGIRTGFANACKRANL